MFRSVSLLASLLLATSTVASPVEVRSSAITLPFVKYISSSSGTVNLVKQDQSRVAALKQRSAAVHFKRQTASANVTDKIISYIASVGVGTPPTTYNLIIDTGFSNTWLGADKPYASTSSSVNMGDTVVLSYGTSSFSGELWLDSVDFNNGLYGKMASIGVANHTTGFSPGVDGVLGLGPIGLTIGTMPDKPSTTIPTITDCIYDTSPGDPLVIVGVSFTPATGDNQSTGELTFGGIDPNKYTGEIIYAPITSTAPSSNLWGIDQSISYGGKQILPQSAGVVDTGSALILIASDAYDIYKSTTGGTEDAITGLLKLTSAQYDNLQNLHFHVYSATYTLTPNAQIWPQSLNSYIGGTNGAIYSVVNSIGTPSGQGLDFVNGQAFVERFYTVFDTQNWQVGFATTVYTSATSN